MQRRLRLLVADPAAFFETASPSAVTSAGVLATVAFTCLGVFGPVLSLLRSPVIPDEAVFDAFPPIRYATADWGVSLPGIVGVLLAVLLVGPILVWLAFTTLFYLLSWPIADERGVGHTAGLVAWGFAPQLIANAVAVAVLAVAFPAEPTELWGLGVTVPARIYASPPAFDPLFAAVTAVGVGCTLWSGYLWAHALAVARGLTLRQAIGVVTVPTILVLGPI